jgi:hypothetical protein
VEEFARPVMLWIAQKAFRPGKIPFSPAQIDTNF